MSNEIQKDDVTLPGGIGTVGIGNTTREITKFVAHGDGAVTLTIGKVILPPETKDIQYEVISPELPPGIQLMLENFRWAKTQMEGCLGINEDRVGRTTAGMVQQYANATRDYESFNRAVINYMGRSAYSLLTKIIRKRARPFYPKHLKSYQMVARLKRFNQEMP